MDRQTNRKTDDLMYGLMDGRLESRPRKQVYGWTRKLRSAGKTVHSLDDRKIYRLAGWIDRWIDIQTDRQADR